MQTPSPARMPSCRALNSRRYLGLPSRYVPRSLPGESGVRCWQDLIKDVRHRLGRGLDWAVSEARRIIHDNDVESLWQLLTDYPALLSWRADENDGGLLGMATDSYGDSGDPAREQVFTRAACAELLIDAGAFVAPSVCDGLIASRAKGLIGLFHRRGLLPRSLKFFAALGEFMYACHLHHAITAAMLLDRAIALDAELGRRIDDGPGRPAFVQYFIANNPNIHNPDPAGPWQAFVMQQVSRAVNDDDLTTFV